MRTVLGSFIFLLVACSAPSVEEREATPQEQRAETLTLTLSDGSTLEVLDVADGPDWACGTRQTGSMKVPGYGAQRITIYYDRDGRLMTVNEPTNTPLYDERGERECLMNWSTNRREMLTEQEYKRFEEASGS